MTTRTSERLLSSLGYLAIASLAACGGHSRFALRAPVIHDSDDQPMAHAPRFRDETDIAHSLDVILLRPLSHGFLFEYGGESRNVNSLDEVPDSTWFTNRIVTPEQLARGSCPDDGPVPPFTIRSSKTGGTTPGLDVVDARGQRYVLKLDALGPRQPEISTAADAIVSRLYWAVGFNVPCNDVVYVDPSVLRIDAHSVEIHATGRRVPLNPGRLTAILASATRGPGGTVRLGASRFIDGQGVGTWRTEGVRPDDPNDVIPHEDRRELRGERYLAAWVNHWDANSRNTYEAFIPAPGGGGYDLHYFLDFSDSLGGTVNRTPFAEPRMGQETVSSVSHIATDAMGFGFVRRAWDNATIDPRYPNLGFLDVVHFDPNHFSPQTPLVSWSRAQPSDLAWMARRIAHVGLEHVRVAVHSGRLSNSAEEDRLVQILMGRRDAILRASFERSSPIADFTMPAPDRLCANDLAIATGIATQDRTTYAVEFREGARLTALATPPTLERIDAAGHVCLTMPPHFAPSNAPDDDARRYATMDIVRQEGVRRSVLRAHFYDLGAERGYVLVGIERL